jgi:integrase
MDIDPKALSTETPKHTQPNKHSVALAKRRKTLPKYLISDQMQALLRSIRDPRDQAIFRLAFHHGLRASELGLIQMRDYRPGKGPSQDYLYIERLKGSLGGNTALVPAAAKAIRMWIKKRGWAAGAMFLSKKKTPISRYQLHRLMQRYCDKAEIPSDKAHFHTLKHSCATIMISDFKESILDVQNHLGHADIRSTMIYAQLTEQANEERAIRLRNWR